MLPTHITVILLSATVPNTFEFASWVGRTKQKHIYVISTLKRPVPLEHFLFASNIAKPDIFKIVDASRQFQADGYKAAWDAVNLPKVNKAKALAEREKQKQRGAKPASHRPNTAHYSHTHGSSSSAAIKQDKNTWMSLVGVLKKRVLLPAVIFTFSKRRCEENADALSNVDLLTASLKSEVHVFIERSLAPLNDSDRQLPQITRMRELLSRGIGVHHGGLLPIIKEVGLKFFS